MSSIGVKLGRYGEHPETGPAAASIPAKLIKIITGFCAPPGEKPLPPARAGAPVSPAAQEWESFCDLLTALEKLISAQTRSKLEPLPTQEEIFTEFQAWMVNNKVVADNLGFKSFGKEGNGVVAKSVLAEGENVVRVPLAAMMTTATAQASPLSSPILNASPMLSQIPSVALAVHLICERFNKDSFWQPYIAVLPHSYSIPLYYSLNEWILLKTTSAFADAAKHLWAVVRQYCVLQRQLPWLTYADFRWAISAVTTRQNRVPLGGTDERPVFGLALIPVWDMCNHAEDGCITVYDGATKTTDCVSRKRYAAGDQVYIFYGERPNYEYLLYSGFVPASNKHDFLRVKLALDSADPLHARKAALLDTLGLPAMGEFALTAPQLAPELIQFLRVSALDEQEISTVTAIQPVSAQATTLSSSAVGPLSVKTERAWLTHLHHTCQQLLRQYPGVEADDRADVKRYRAHKNGFHNQSIMQLKLAERQLLAAVVQSSQRCLDALKSGAWAGVAAYWGN